jgi:hypothetical protein
MVIESEASVARVERSINWLMMIGESVGVWMLRRPRPEVNTSQDSMVTVEP